MYVESLNVPRTEPGPKHPGFGFIEVEMTTVVRSVLVTEEVVAPPSLPTSGRPDNGSPVCINRRGWATVTRARLPDAIVRVVGAHMTVGGRGCAEEAATVATFGNAFVTILGSVVAINAIRSRYRGWTSVYQTTGERWRRQREEATWARYEQPPVVSDWKRRIFSRT